MCNRFPYKLCTIYYLHIWNPYNEAEDVLLETHKFWYLPGTVFIKSYVFSLSWKTTSLERLKYLMVTLFGLNCITAIRTWSSFCYVVFWSENDRVNPLCSGKFHLHQGNNNCVSKTTLTNMGEQIKWNHYRIVIFKKNRQTQAQRNHVSP